MKILNLYAGIGGNRKLWPISDNDEVVAVEIEPKIAKKYADAFPKDQVVIADAHQYLLDHYKEFDFIWSSPPCQSHGSPNNFLHYQGVVRYPDMKLYEEVIFLKRYCKVPFVVENVNPYYVPLYVPFAVGRHRFWSNFHITNMRFYKAEIGTWNRKVSPAKAKLSNKKQEENNCVPDEIGLHVFNCAFKTKQLLIGELKGVQ